MAEETWHSARLIPTSGISGAEEQERRATSALLAVMSAVKEFGRAITAPLGAPAGSVETFIEVPFTAGEKRLFPDGLIRVSRGSRSWVCLVEVKTGSNQLEAAQLESYLDVARDEGFDALLTISNEIPAMAGTHPTSVDKRKLRRVAIHHLSWTQVLTAAVMQKVHRGVADPDQAWILGELIRYLEGGLRIPNAVGPVTVCADLRAGRVFASVDIDAPREGRPQTGVNWLIRQLKDAPDSLRVDCFARHGRGTSTSELLRDVRASPVILIEDPKRDLRAFRLTASAPMGTKRGHAKGSFVGAVLELLDGFYASTVQTIKPWAAPPPKLRSPQPPPGVQDGVPPQIVSTSLSSQDGAEVAPTLGPASGASADEGAVPIVEEDADDHRELLGDSSLGIGVMESDRPSDDDHA